jgi:hypothetical protein
MKKYSYSIFLFIILILFLPSCSNKKDEISKLMKEKNYSQARQVVNTLSKEELNSPELLCYLDTLSFLEIDSLISEYGSKNAYSAIDNLLNNATGSTIYLVPFKDTLTSLKEFYAFKGAQYYCSIGLKNKAFEIIKKYMSRQYFTKDQSQIINQILKNVIAGSWKGVNTASNKIVIEMVINPLTSRSFEGVLKFRGEPWHFLWPVALENGVFDGYELSAQANVWDLAFNSHIVEQLTLVGNIQNDTMYIHYDLTRLLAKPCNEEWILSRK